MWHVGNTPTWQVVVHDKRGGDFDGEINLRLKENSSPTNDQARTQLTFINGRGRTQKNVALWEHNHVACWTHGFVGSDGA